MTSSIVTRILRPAEGPTISSSRHQQRPPARQRRHFELDLKILDIGLSGSNAIEEYAQTRIVEVQSAGAADRLTDRLVPLCAEGVVEDLAGGNDTKFVIENHKRLADGLYNAVGIGPRRFEFVFRYLRLRDVGKGDDHALDPIIILVRQDAPQVPCCLRRSRSRG